MDELGRFYTNNLISELLISKFENQSPGKVLDLGVGNASLSIAAYNKWQNAAFFATEIELKKVNHINENLTFLKVYNYDTLLPNVSAKLKIKFGSIDIAICNPPYIKVEEKEKYLRLFKDINCEEFFKLKRITSEIVFFAHNLKLLKKNGELGIIVSDSLITGKDFQLFRETILKRFELNRIIQLPDKIFNKTEARTHIVFLSKKKCTNDTCELNMSNMSGSLKENILVKKDLLIERMDYQFHNFSSGIRSSQLLCLKDVSTIKRGKYSYKELKDGRFDYVHTNSLKSNDQILSFGLLKNQELKRFAASSGDILMVRVGKRCVGRIAKIKKGSIVFSDCIYRISIQKDYRSIVWKSLRSSLGQSWLKAYAHGVCSQVVSKSDLEKFPLFSLLDSSLAVVDLSLMPLTHELVPLEPKPEGSGKPATRFFTG